MEYSSIETAREMATIILEDSKFSKWMQSPDEFFGNIGVTLSDATNELFTVKAKLYCLAATLLVLSDLEPENPKLSVVRSIIENSVLKDRPTLKPPTLDAVINLHKLLTYQPDSPDFRKNVMLWAQNWLRATGQNRS